MADNPIKHSDIIQPGQPFDDMIKGLEKVIKLTKEAAKEFKKFAEKQNPALKEGQKNIQAVTKATKQLSIKEKEALKIKQQLAREQAKLNLMSSKEYKNLIKTREAAKAKNAEMRRAAQAMRTGAKTTNTWGKALGSFAFKFNALGNMAANVASKITRTFSRAVRGAMTTIMEFEQAMADVRAVTNATDKEFKALSKSARDLGGSTKFTAIEVSKLQKELAKLGFSTEEILNAQDAILSLAAATNTDLARAAEVAAITIRQFGLDASETQRVVDVMAKSFSTSALDLEKFADSMKFVGPAAKASGKTLEQTTAMLAQLADAGISASLGGTALRRIFLEMAKQGKDASSRIKELSMAELGLAEANDEVKARAATALIVLADGAGTVDDYAESLRNAAGAAQTMADIQLDTLQGKITILKSSWDRYILSLASSEDEFIFLKGVIDGTSSGLNEMATSVEENKEETTKFNKALKNLWEGTKRSIPIWGNMVMQQDAITAKLIENKKAAKELQESFGELASDTEVEKVVEVLEDIAKPETIATFQEQLTKLQKQRKDASLAEIGAINREITAIEAKIKKYKEIGAILPPISEVEEWYDEDIEIDALSWDRKDTRAKESLDFRKRMSKQFREEDKEAAKKQSEDDKKLEDEKQAKISATFELANRLTTTFTSLFESQKQKELSAVGDNAEKRAEIEKKFRKKQQLLAISQAIVDGASSILKTKAQLGLPAAIPFMIADAALTAAQIGVIASQKFGEGEVDIDGPSHSRGGINAEIEGGESVINKRSTSKHRALLEAINANDSASIANAALQNEAFHEVWGRTRTKEVIVKGGSDPWTKKMYEMMSKTPVYLQDGPRTEYYPALDKKRIYK